MSGSDNLREGLIYGENSTLEHTAQDVGDARVALFFALVRGVSNDRILEMCKACVDDAPDNAKPGIIADLFVMAFQTRDCRGGKGERDIFYTMMLQLFEKFPSTVVKVLPLVGDYGYFKDLFRMIEVNENDFQCASLRSRVIDVIVNQLIADEVIVDTASAAGTTAAQLAELRRKVSMCAKYVPREGKRFSKGGVLKEIALKLFPESASTAKAQYRLLVSKITKFLDVPEVKMCGKRYGEIDFSRVPSVCSKKFCKAFLNEKLKKAPTSEEFITGNRFPHDEDRVLSRKHLRDTIAEGKVKGKQLYPHQIVEKLMKDNNPRKPTIGSLELEMLNVQWNDIRQNLLDQLAAKTAELDAAAAGGANQSGAGAAAAVKRGMDVGRLVPLSDVSGSMSGLPMMVSIALGILISEVNHAAFRDRVVTFETSPRWVDLSECSTIAEKVKKLAKAPWGGSTNIEKAFEKIAKVVSDNKLPMAEVPDLIIFSDMQFDQALDRGAALTQLERIRERFYNLGMEICGEPYPAPRIIFWNLRSGTVGFPAQSESENVQMLSGFSPALLKFVLEGAAEDDAEEEEEEEEDMVVVGADGEEVTRPEKKQKKKGPTPYSTLRKVLDDERYFPVRRLMSESTEGWLQGYTFTEPPANDATSGNLPVPPATTAAAAVPPPTVDTV